VFHIKLSYKHSAGMLRRWLVIFCAKGVQKHFFEKEIYPIRSCRWVCYARSFMSIAWSTFIIVREKQQLLKIFTCSV